MKPILKLGRQPKKYDPRTLKLSAYLKTEELPTLPLSYFWPAPAAWGMMANDQLGDCTCAGAGHAIMQWTVANGDLFTPPDAAIVAAYSAITGYNPADPSTDQGAAEIDVLNYWRKTGIAGHLIGAYAEINPAIVNQVKYAVYLFGVAYIGLSLPLAYQGADGWTDPPNLTGSWLPGSWGGHAVIVVGYDATGVTVITWGAPLKMTWAAFAAYCVEAYAIFSTDFVTGVKDAPNGFAQAALQEDLNCLNA